MTKATANSVINLLAEDQSLILYRKSLRQITGSVTSAILLSQMLYWFGKSGNKPFYKFRKPCAHEDYREGDSWTEELEFSEGEFDYALKKIGTKITKGMSKIAAFEKEDATGLIIYWTDASRKTWYMVNANLLSNQVLASRSNADYLDSSENLITSPLTETTTETKKNLTTSAKKPPKEKAPKKPTSPKKKKAPKAKKAVGFIDKFLPYKEYGRVFSELTGLKPTKWQHVIMWSYGSEKSGAMGFRDFIEVGITVDEMKLAIQEYKRKSNRYPIKNPNTIYTIANEISQKNRSKNAKKSVVNRDAGFGQEVLDYQEAVRRASH